jgi:hypothetical protein
MADLRSKTQDLFQSAFSNMGISDARSLELAQDFAGRPDADTILGSLGVLDFTPAGLVFGAQDAYRDFKKAETPADYGMASGMMALSAAEAFPATKGLAKYIKKTIKPKTGALPDDVDLSKRQTVKTLGALPVAAVVADPLLGALSNLGTKAPVAKTAKVATKTVNPSLLKTFRNSFNMFDDDIKGDYNMAMGNIFDPDMNTDDIMNNLEEFLDVSGTRSITPKDVEDILRKNGIKNPEKVTIQDLRSNKIAKELAKRDTFLTINRAIDEDVMPNFTSELSKPELNKYTELETALKNKKIELMETDLSKGEVNNKLFDEFEKLSGL